MAEKIKKNIVCPCGRLLGTNPNYSGGGTKQCPSCKRKVRYEVTPTRIYVHYEN